MSSIWGSSIKVSIFGESHGKGIGVVIDGAHQGMTVFLQREKRTIIQMFFLVL